MRAIAIQRRSWAGVSDTISKFVNNDYLAWVGAGRVTGKNEFKKGAHFKIPRQRWRMKDSDSNQSFTSIFQDSKFKERVEKYVARGWSICFIANSAYDITEIAAFDRGRGELVSPNTHSGIKKADNFTVIAHYNMHMLKRGLGKVDSVTTSALYYGIVGPMIPGFWLVNQITGKNRGGAVVSEFDDINF